MKFAIIADIHANLEAFQVVLEDIKNQKCTHYACLGDVVGYNADPKKCLDIVREMNIPCVKGNHDEYCSSNDAMEGFNPAAAQAVAWTRKQLSEDDKQWLRDLKYQRMVNNFTIVHATLDGLSKLKPAFGADGTVTAGNASGMVDGAACLVIAGSEAAGRDGHAAEAGIMGRIGGGGGPWGYAIGPGPP